jgi:hypothetical protein
MTATAERLNMWSSDTNEDSRIEGGYEKVPVQDVFVVRYMMSGQGDLAPHNVSC